MTLTLTPEILRAEERLAAYRKEYQRLTRQMERLEREGRLNSPIYEVCLFELRDLAHVSRRVRATLPPEHPDAVQHLRGSRS